jgi:hypothetical protein
VWATTPRLAGNAHRSERGDDLALFLHGASAWREPSHYFEPSDETIERCPINRRPVEVTREGLGGILTTAPFPSSGCETRIPSCLSAAVTCGPDLHPSPASRTILGTSSSIRFSFG